MMMKLLLLLLWGGVFFVNGFTQAYANSLQRFIRFILIDLCDFSFSNSEENVTRDTQYNRQQ